MTRHIRIHPLRSALAEGDAGSALRLLAEIRAENYPKSLLRPLLSSCHPGLDEHFLDLDLVPAGLLIAPLLPEALNTSLLDPRRLSLTHGCGPIEFAKHHLNEVLSGQRPLYDDLPAIDIFTYLQLVQLSPIRSGWLKRLTVLECLALEATAGIESEASALSRWRPSRHDALLERPWIWIQASSGQVKAGPQTLDISFHGALTVTNASEASALIKNATDHLLRGGATYLLWNSADQPPDTWISILEGLQQRLSRPFHQIGETRHGLEEMHPIRFSEERALLAIDAAWLARRTPGQVLSFLTHCLSGPPLKWRNSSRLELSEQREPLIQPTLCEGILVLAVCRAQVQELGLESLNRRATQRALEGGFARGIVIELEPCSGPTIHQQIACFSSSDSGFTQILVFMGVDDYPAPESWDSVSRYLSIRDNVLLCSDEELQWSVDPNKIGQRQFFGKPSLFRMITRGQLPGLVAAQATLLSELEYQQSYLSLHAFLKDLSLQWANNFREVSILPQALLRRNLSTNPTILSICTASQDHPFSTDQLLEINKITRRRAASWLQPYGRIEPGVKDGCFELQRTLQPEDKVSVIIPFRNQASLTRDCVLSLLEKETSTPFELILVDNGSTESAAIDLSTSLAPLAQTHGINITPIRDDRPFNFSALNNNARLHCTGNYLLFLNNDIRFVSPNPLQHLLDPFAFRGTGAVGSRLIYEDGTIQHNGLVAAAFQSHDVLSAGKGLRPGAETDSFTPLMVQEEWSAATAACLLIKSQDFDRLGGFNEELTVAYNDVDLCWRLLAENFAVVVTPFPKIIHAESKSRGEDIAGDKRNRLARESGYLRSLYPKFFHNGDPLYHSFLQPTSHRFEPAELPSKFVGNSRTGLLYSWTNLNFKPGVRPFIIYVHYDSNGDVRPDIFEQLKAYRSYCDIAFVSASPKLCDRPRLLDKLQDACDVVLVRHNEGYDFGSWQAGILYCQRYLGTVSRLILANDSCYGPLYSLDNLFSRISASHADVIGLTDSTAISYHLQSYFVAYGRRILSSQVFWRFWEQIKIWPTKVDLVRACEVGWSDILIKAGFKLEALYLEGEHGNVTHTHWRELLEEHEFPFIKTELLRVNPILQDIKSWREIASKYNPKITQTSIGANRPCCSKIKN